MDLTDKEKATIQYYNTHADEWARGHAGSGSFWSDELVKFHELLPAGKILEVGVGGGQEAAEFIELGYNYTGIDASISLLKIARKINPKGSFLHQSVYDLDFPKATFDGFWTAATLLHIPKNRVRQALKNLQQVTKPGGIGFISLIEGEGESVEKQTGRFFSYYTEKEFSKILTDLKISIIASGKKKQNSWSTWLTFFVKNT